MPFIFIFYTRLYERESEREHVRTLMCTSIGGGGGDRLPAARSMQEAARSSSIQGPWDHDLSHSIPLSHFSSVHTTLTCNECHILLALFSSCFLLFLDSELDHKTIYGKNNFLFVILPRWWVWTCNNCSLNSYYTQFLLRACCKCVVSMLTVRLI